MLYTTRIRYGIRALVELGLNYEKGPLLLKVISKKQDLSMKYLDHIFSQLKKSGIIKKMTAKKGGYLLNRPPEDITLYDIIEAIEGISKIECLDDPKTCKRAGKCGIKVLWGELNNRINEVLKGITLADFVKEQKKLQEADKPIMFSI